MRPKTLLSTLLLMLTAQAALADGADPSVMARLEPGSGIRVDRGAADSEAQLNKDWGQFEFSLPKKHFPIAAPHCKSRIQLRLIALPPQAEKRETRLAERWRLLQALRELEAGQPLTIELSLDLRHYVERRVDGTLKLRYCNAFSDGGHQLIRR